MKSKILKNKKGYTLIETLFYIALFTILALAVINSLIIMTKAFKETAIQTDLSQSSSILERISREVRQAYGINTISANNLKLDTKDELGNDKTVRFVLTESNDVRFLENDIFIGNLNSANVKVTGLSFTQVTMSTGQAIKIVLSVRSLRDNSNRIENFYDTVVLRGTY